MPRYIFTSVLLAALLILNRSSDDEAGDFCWIRGLDEPVAAQDGDFVIGAIFNIGNLVSYNKTGNDSHAQYCSYETIREYNVQKAIILRDYIDKQGVILKAKFNKTLGYEMYDACADKAVTTRASTRIVSNKKIIGVSGADNAEYVKRSAQVTASYHIPTFVYMFSDNDLMDESLYPTVFSMIDTEINEAKITIEFLKMMGYTYMDIWYHSYSKEMAYYIYDSYVKKVGCGRIREVTTESHIPRIRETLEQTGGSASQVQLILSNSFARSKLILNETVNSLGFKNKIYIFGISNGRASFIEEYIQILNSTAGNNTLVFPLADFLNTQIENSSAYLNEDWTRKDTRDPIDSIYRIAQRNKCPYIDGIGQEKQCGITSWLPYMIGGTQLVLDALNHSLASPTNSECNMDNKDTIFRNIIEEGRNVQIQFSSQPPVEITVRDKTITTGYKFSVYESKTGESKILGRGYRDRMTVTDPDLLESISGYQKTCSSMCLPGWYRVFERGLDVLPCCWKCSRCPTNHISTTNNSNVCQECDSAMSSNDAHTACLLTPEIYIQVRSYKFIIGASCVPFGMIMVIATGIIVFRNEDRPVIKASDPGYLYMTLFSLLLGYPTALVSLMKPSESVCSTEYFCFGVFVTLISTNLLYKCVKVYDIFAAAQNFKSPTFGKLLKSTGQTALNLITLSTTLVILLIDKFTGEGQSWGYKRYQQELHSSWYLVCASRSMGVLGGSMVMPTIFFLITMILAFKMRQFPHNFRESLNIFCATFVVVLCSIMFLAGYNYSPPEVQPFLRSIVLFITCTAFLLCIFLPKIAILSNKNIDVDQERQQVLRAVRKFSSAPKGKAGAGPLV